MSNETSTQVVHVRLHDFGDVLATRGRGRRTASQVQRIAERPGDVLLDFRDVEVATPPFLQELTNAIDALVHQDPERGRIVLAANMNDDVCETFAFVLGRRRRTLAFRKDSRLDLLDGKPHLRQTLEAAQKLCSFTAPQLAEQLKINDDTATQRLRQLLENGAVTREEDEDATRGRRHRYRAPAPELARAAG